MRAARAALLALVALGTTGVSGSRLARVAAPTPEHELLYLPNGRLLKLLSLGQAPLLADVVYLWAIQHYSDYERTDRYAWVEHVFDGVITELDPCYVDAYWLGGLILILEAGDLEAGLRLLDKGARNNPREWILPYLAGWECYRAGQKDRAQSYFARATAVPGAPAILPRVIAGIEAQKGNLRQAIALWEEILADPGSAEATRAIAARRIRELRGKADVADLEAAIERFRNDNGRSPRRLEELLARSYIDALPVDPAGRPYGYDPRTGTVSSSAARVLGGS